MLIVASLLVTSCYKLDESSVEPPPPVARPIAFSERTFIQDTNMYALPGEVIVIHLEHQNTPPDSIPAGTDTDGIGVDIVPFKLRDTVNISFRLDTTIYTIEMYDKETGQKVLLLNEDIRQRVRRYSPGDYLIHITSLLNYDDDTLNFQLIFIQPDVSSAKSTSLGQDNEIFWFIQSRLRVCKECTMRYGEFSGFDFSLAQFTDADFYKANLKSTILPLADLSGADLSGADLSNADIPYSDFYNSILENTVLNNANLDGAFLQYADFTNASLRNASAIGADFCNTIRKGWDIIGMEIDSTTLCLP